MMWKTMAAAGLALGTLFGALAAPPPAQAEEKLKVFLSMSWIGNDWQTSAMNMITALSRHKDYADKMDFSVQASGDNAQRQIQQINAMVQQGADIIIVYPISPTALNQVIKNACNRGVIVFTYDSVVEEPCAYHVGIDAEESGYQRAKWLFTELDGKGDVVELTGAAGTSFDARINAGTARALAEFPDIKIIASANGQWSQAEARVQMTKILATHSWDQIDGLLVQTGCGVLTDMQIESGIAEDQVKPCGGEAANGHRIKMLPPGTVDGAIGLRSFSSGSGVFGAAVALKLAMKVKAGEEVAKSTVITHSPITTDTAKLCVEGTAEEIRNGCNVLNPELMPNPFFYADVFEPELLPELGLDAVLLGQPEP